MSPDVTRSSSFSRCAKTYQQMVTFPHRNPGPESMHSAPCKLQPRISKKGQKGVMQASSHVPFNSSTTPTKFGGTRNHSHLAFISSISASRRPYMCRLYHSFQEDENAPLTHTHTHSLVLSTNEVPASIATVKA